MISVLPFFECIYRFSLLSFDDMKLTFIIKRIFQSPDFLSSYIILPKYGSMFIKYCSIDSFSLPSLLYLIYLSLKASAISIGS